MTDRTSDGNPIADRIIRVTETHTVEPDQATHDGCDGTHVRSASGSIVLCDKEGISTDGR